VSPVPSKRKQAAPDVRLAVDPIACDGIAMCSHLASHLIAMDPWGFPVMPHGPLQPRDLRAARSAVSGCPRNALFLKERNAQTPP
jgi:ferredoxin